jgi:hypothetical protein
MNRRHFLIGAAALLPGCSAINTIFGPGGGNTEIQITYKTAIATETAAGILFNAGAALVTTDVIKVGSSTYKGVDTAFDTLAAAVDAANADIQAGTPQPIALLLNAASAALTAAQEALAKSKDAANQSSKLLQMNRAMAIRQAPQQTQGFALPAILMLVETLLPIVLQAGGALAQLIQGNINGSGAPNGPTYSPADVQAANVTMHAGLSAWKAAVN